MKNNNTETCHVYYPDEIATILGIGMTSVYEFLKRQEIEQNFKVLRIGKFLRVEKDSFDRWLSM